VSEEDSTETFVVLIGVSVIPHKNKVDSSGNAVGDLPVRYRDNNPLFDGRRVNLRVAPGKWLVFSS